jgi:hypothetical protein
MFKPTPLPKEGLSFGKKDEVPFDQFPEQIQKHYQGEGAGLIMGGIAA